MTEAKGEEVPKIHGAMIKVMQAVGPIAKERTNQGGGNYKFRGIDDVYNALHEIMAENGVYCMPEVFESERTERVSKNNTMMFYTIHKVKFTFYAEDGSSVSCITPGEGMDSGDKSSNKAMSGAHKIALLQAFMIPTEDKKDSEEESPEIKPEAKTIEDVEADITGCTAMPHLMNIYNKYAPVFKADTVAYKRLIEAKEKKKKELSGGGE